MNLKDCLNRLKNKFCRQREQTDTADIENTEKDAEPTDARSAFLESLDALSADDIAPKTTDKRTLADILRSMVRPAAMLVCGCVFVGSAASLIQRVSDYRRGDEIYGSIADNIFDADLAGEHAVALSDKLPQSPAMLDYYTSLSADASELITDSTGEVNKKFEQVKANLLYLQTINPDIYGFIHIDGTNISFPIVQGTDNEYYLNRAWNGDFLVVGSIYADFRADKNIENNYNTVFYGHNMSDGNMFNNVMLFREEDVFNSKVIEIYTFDGVYTYEPFAIFQTVYTYPYFRMEFESDEDFVSFCEEMQSQSLFSKDMTFTGDDHIITLSTCTPSDDVASYYVGRIALHAKLVKSE